MEREKLLRCKQINAVLFRFRRTAKRIRRARFPGCCSWCLHVQAHRFRLWSPTRRNCGTYVMESTVFVRSQVRLGTALDNLLPDLPVGIRVITRFPRVDFVLLPHPYPSPGYIWYYFRYPTKILGRLATTHRTLPKVAGRFATTLGTLLCSTPGIYLGIYPRPGHPLGSRQNGVLVTSYCVCYPNRLRHPFSGGWATRLRMGLSFS